jgi:hypothetical protein
MNEELAMDFYGMDINIPHRCMKSTTDKRLRNMSKLCAIASQTCATYATIGMINFNKKP